MSKVVEQGEWAAPAGEPAGSGSGTAESSGSDKREPRGSSFGENIEWPFDSFRSAVEWWYHPLVEARSWTALGSLFVGSIWGPLVFTVVLLIVVLTFVFSLLGVGLLLIVPAFGAINAMASVERRRAVWIGEEIPAPPLAAPAGGMISAITTRLTDAARWRQILFFGLFVVAGPFFFTLGVMPWGLLMQMVFGPDFDTGLFTVFDGGLLMAAVLAGAAPRITIVVAQLGRSFTAALLGPTETAELQERVSELSGQRQQILDAVAGERRRIERNLHDGVQQQLVALAIDIGRAQARVEQDPDGANELLDQARDKVRGSIGELRLIGRGLHPAVLEDRGLDAALSAVVANSSIPITVTISTDAKLPEDIAATAYYVANEGVANMLKHAKARIGSIRLEDDPDMAEAVRLTIHDDGQGGADFTRGSGLVGMRARVEGLDGTLQVDSPFGGPTTLVAVLPLDVLQPVQYPAGFNPS